MVMFISPMRMDAREKPFSDQAYVFEPKIDGHRLLLSRNGAETRLFTRERRECTRQYPELLNVPADGDIVLDGEVSCIDAETGAEAAGLAEERLLLADSRKIHSFSLQKPAQYHVWDILFYKGRDLRGLPLVRRRAILESVLPENEAFRLVPQTDGHGEALYRTIVERHMEGMVAKRKSSPYVSRWSHDWIKIMNYRHEEVAITGYRKDGFGWLLSKEEEGVCRPAGMLEQGVHLKHRKAFKKLSKALVSGEDEQFVYLKPQIQAKVKSIGWTRHGLLRSPELIELKL
ncbi:ATP-dependent DNA ligase [Paenibacillus sp. H1-7]|nr:ATP-dependent DNA ligase [Paenibacillus sp. H1-7]